MTRQVTEKDFRMPEFRDANPEDYEFRADGKLVRKDRWYRGFLEVVSIAGCDVREFEIDDVIQKLRTLTKQGQKPFGYYYVPEEKFFPPVVAERCFTEEELEGSKKLIPLYKPNTDEDESEN